MDCYVDDDANDANDETVCYGDLGCFNITADFHHIVYRPLNVLPESPDTVRTRVYLYTRPQHNNNKNNSNQTGRPLMIPDQWLNRNIISNNNSSSSSDKFMRIFDGNRETKLIVHGLFDSLEQGKWIHRLKDELLVYGDYNVLVVDWSNGNGLPYTQAVANARLVAAQIVLLLKNLQRSTNKLLKFDKCHIIGHSLGAQIAGYVGQLIGGSGSTPTKNKLGRISGLDPAAPMFQSMPESVRLDSTDALFVDVIHTDTLNSLINIGAGTKHPVGHMDFYPNGGHDQPGCAQDKIKSILDRDLMESTRLVVACNHLRANEYYIEKTGYMGRISIRIRPQHTDYLSINNDAIKILPNTTYYQVVSLDSRLNLSGQPSAAAAVAAAPGDHQHRQPIANSIDIKWSEDSFNLLDTSTWSFGTIFRQTIDLFGNNDQLGSSSTGSTRNRTTARNGSTKRNLSKKLVFIKHIWLRDLSTGRLLKFCNTHSQSGIPSGGGGGGGRVARFLSSQCNNNN
ncbi:pancreatic triacylglycerol lipase-like [Oppia nitens]|uniref:pancreatic triacylglycerol lipase-like n=1 Tax=Oppia nitens TaxID=1686743 RepID=UPI0023DA89F6|nr:pancreatic triacylglycerol lipase-like [Oppia nitens]